MTGYRWLAIAGIPLVAAFIAISGCGSQAGSQASNSSTATTGSVVTIHYKLVGAGNDAAKAGPDGKKHDTFAAVDPATVHVGDTVNIVVDSYDDGAHGMVFPDLGLSQAIKGGGTEDKPVETTYTFTASKAGTFRWYCPAPCDTDNNQWAMSAGGDGSDQTGFMAGTISVS